MLLYVPIMLPFFTYEQICLIADLATPIVAMISLVIAYFSLNYIMYYNNHNRNLCAFIY